MGELHNSADFLESLEGAMEPFMGLFLAGDVPRVTPTITELMSQDDVIAHEATSQGEVNMHEVKDSEVEEDVTGVEAEIGENKVEDGTEITENKMNRVEVEVRAKAEGDEDQLVAELMKHVAEVEAEIKGDEVLPDFVKRDTEKERKIEEDTVLEDLYLEEGEAEGEIDADQLLAELTRRAVEAEADIAGDDMSEDLSTNDAEAETRFEVQREMMLENEARRKAEAEAEAQFEEEQEVLENEARRETEAEAEILAEARRKADAEALAEARQAEAEALAEDRAKRLADPSLALPVPSRPDWNADMEMLRAFVDDPNVTNDEKVRVLHEALVQRIDDEGKADEVKNRLTRRRHDASTERERLRAEVQRALVMKSKLEVSCRDLQQLKTNITRENEQIAEEEQSRHFDMKEKFEEAIKDVQEKMDQDLEVQQHKVKENEDLRSKLTEFTEQYEAQEKQDEEQQLAREHNIQSAEQQIKKHEAARAEAMKNTAYLEKENAAMRKSQPKLRADVKAIVDKFDEFRDSVTGSNERHADCKTEIESLRDELHELERVNSDLKKCPRLTTLPRAAGSPEAAHCS